MYAILQHGGHQYRVASGDRILVDRIPVEVGSTVTLESVLLIGDGAETDVAKGSPVEASVTATVIAHRRGRKIRVFTYKPKKRHRRTLGYRSQLTELRIDEVARGKAAEKPKAAAKPRKAAQPEAEAAPEASKAVAEAVKAEAADLAVEESRRHRRRARGDEGGGEEAGCKAQGCESEEGTRRWRIRKAAGAPATDATARPSGSASSVTPARSSSRAPSSSASAGRRSSRASTSGVGRDHTLFALRTGTVAYDQTGHDRTRANVRAMPIFSVGEMIEEPVDEEPVAATG